MQRFNNHQTAARHDHAAVIVAELGNRTPRLALSSTKTQTQTQTIIYRSREQ